MDVQGPFRTKADENAILGRSGIYRITTSSNIELFCKISSSSEPRNITCTVDTNFKEGVRLSAEYLRIPFNPNSIEVSSLSIYQDAVEFWNAMKR